VSVADRQRYWLLNNTDSKIIHKVSVLTKTRVSGCGLLQNLTQQISENMNQEYILVSLHVFKILLNFHETFITSDFISSVTGTK
jgi:hypothetical protein